MSTTIETGLAEVDLIASDTTPHQPTSTSTSTPTTTSLVATRHSIRAFLPTPIPHQILTDCFALAQTTPSNSNAQPWRITVLQGPALHRVSAALHRAVENGVEPTTLPIPEKYLPYRSVMGSMLYGETGYNIPRTDKERLEKARRRNYDFFDAPVALIVGIDDCLADVDVLSVGMYLHTLTLLLAERGVGSCYQVSIAGYPDVLREELGIGREVKILTGMAVGYEDKEARINALRCPRDEWTRNVRFVEE
jgi:nitroreductase